MPLTKVKRSVIQEDLFDFRYYTQAQVDDLISTISGSLDDHNEANNIQGGTTDEYYHLTAADHTALTTSGTANYMYYVGPDGRMVETSNMTYTPGTGVDINEHLRVGNDAPELAGLVLSIGEDLDETYAWGEYITLDNASSDPGAYTRGLYVQVSNTTSSGHTLIQGIGGLVNAANNSGANIDEVIGVTGAAGGTGDNNVITKAIGGQFSIFSGGGIVNSEITTAIAGEFQTLTAGGSGDVSVTDGYGALIKTPAFNPTGTTTNLYGMYIEDQSTVGFVNDYNIYSAGASSMNKFEGDIEFGGTISGAGDIYCNDLYTSGDTIYVGTGQIKATAGSIDIPLGTLRVGSEDTVYGTIKAFGQATGSDQGGKVVLETAADWDGGIPPVQRYTIQAYERDLQIVRGSGGGGTPDLEFIGSGAFWRFPLGDVWIGEDNTQRGTLNLSGDDSLGGGLGILTENSASAINTYLIRPVGEDLLIGPDIDPDSLMYLEATGVWKFTGAGGLQLATGPAVNTIETTLTDDDTHIPTSGAVVDYITTVTGSLPSPDKIEEGNSSVEVIDLAVGSINMTADGTNIFYATDSAQRFGIESDTKIQLIQSANQIDFNLGGNRRGYWTTGGGFIIEDGAFRAYDGIFLYDNQSGNSDVYITSDAGGWNMGCNDGWNVNMWGATGAGYYDFTGTTNFRTGEHGVILRIGSAGYVDLAYRNAVVARTYSGKLAMDALQLGGNAESPSGPVVDTIETSLTDDDTHLPTSGAVVDYVTTVTGSLPAPNKISQGNSSVEVTDTGTGKIEVTADGNLVGEYVYGRVRIGDFSNNELDIQAGGDEVFMRAGDEIHLIASASTKFENGSSLIANVDSVGINLKSSFGLQFEQASLNDLEGSGEITDQATIDANGTGIGALLYRKSNGAFAEADADSAATMPCVAVALQTGTGTFKKVLFSGYIRNDAWNFTSIGQPVYVSSSTGDPTQAKPSGEVQAIGIAWSADILWFNSNTDVEGDYLKQDGSTQLTGDWDFGSNTISGTGNIYCDDLYASFTYYGDPTISGTWRAGPSGENFVHQKYNGSTWDTKNTISG